ncbi:MAG: preprotein translocase subunit SecA [Clostridia bacterium]|nr:preprotein translocase subunit SecA [Clostridia bacterium]MDD4375644.1 preprotein translocase subunit SecA [Clostridia bacterium]
MNIFEKVFGSYSSKEIKKILPIVDKIESLDEDMQKLSDAELKAKTDEFKKRLTKGETLEDILVEAFAVVREGAYRSLNMKHFRVQLIGGIILHQGRIAEMKTGEGKTLVATLPVYLNALTGKGVHVVTVNDYLAERDSVWMGKVYNFLGLTVGLVVPGMSPAAKKIAYNCDVIYATNNELGFDYLRDNMCMSKEDMVQKELSYGIVDEIDSILIDEARTPLIISGQGDKSTELYERSNKLVSRMKAREIVEGNDKEFDEENEKYDYVIDLKAKSVSLTEKGTKKCEEFFGLTELADMDNMEISHHINQALKAHGIMKRDIDYIEKDGEILIVDEFTGRIMDGRRYSDGLHQAIEAKEGVTVESESKTLATITFQNYFRLYSKLSGMTGTAKTEEAEFKGIYGLDVIEIPTNKDTIRIDNNDVVYKTEKGKFNAIVEDVKESYEKGQPVLVGTVSIEKSEELSRLLDKARIPHKVLNAKHHQKEAEIVAQAGKYGTVTIATNMAGRGTDIVLGGNAEFLAKRKLLAEGKEEDKIEFASGHANTDDMELLEIRKRYKSLESEYKKDIQADKSKVIQAGGLKIIGSERHESRRIDNQLRGRSGRQGDPGESRFYISLEDDLMRLFGSDRVTAIAEMMQLPEDMPIEMGMLTTAIETAQKRVEGRNYSIRKSVLEYDDVMNKQREIIYKQRRQILESESVEESLMKIAETQISHIVEEHFAIARKAEEVDLETFNINLSNLFGKNNYVLIDDIEKINIDKINEKVLNKVKEIYNERIKTFTDKGEIEAYRNIEKYLMLKTVDEKWMNHIDDMTHLKDGIHLRAYGQNNPVDAYKIEGYDLFEEMNYAVQQDVIKAVYTLNITRTDNVNNVNKFTKLNRNYEKQNISNFKNEQSSETAKKPIKVEKKVGRNEPCPCGSGKKYKFCCGKEVG